MQLPSVSILHVPIATSSQADVVRFLYTCVQRSGWHHIITTNNEMLVEAQRNSEFLSVLQGSTANIADSTGVVLASKLTHSSIKERSTGVDSLQKLCALLQEHQSVFLLGAAPGVAEAAAKTLQHLYANLRIAGTYSGSPKPSESEYITQKITESGAQVLFVAFGAPQQDIWLDTYKQQLPTIRLAMGVGGSFDFLAGTIKRAPRVFRSLGLEWLWRFMLQPTRYKRMWKAVVVFPWLVFISFLRKQ